MRKPLIALSLAVSAGMGASSVADALAATTASHVNKGSTPPRSTTTTQSSPTYSTYPQTQSSAGARSGNFVSGASIVQYAMKYLGYPYTATGNSPSTGFSCIGFVSYVYRSLGISLPGDLGDALAYAPQVPFSALQPGDILYFQNTVWQGLSHAAIYIGGGKFVHAEWYNRGVTISSFNNDPVDGNYWIGKYLGANRPWGGAALGAVVVPGTGSTSSTTITAPSTTSTRQVSSGPATLVTVPSLNVRSAPSKSSAVQQTVPRGTSMTVLGHRNGWYKVQLADGSIGWVVAVGIGKGSTQTPVSSSAVPGNAGLGVNGVAPKTTIGAVSTPSHIASPYKKRAVASVKVSGLRVHTGPSIASSVVTSVSQGQHLTVLQRRNGWIKVRMPDGTTGWVSGQYTSARRTPVKRAGVASAAPVRASAQAFTGGSIARVATNVRTTPSLSGTITTVLVPGARYRVLGAANGWTRVQLSDGTTGWISSSLATHRTTMPSARNTSRSAPRTRGSAAVGTSVVTAGVRVHSGPGLKSPVVTLAAPGTHVRVLGYANGWALVRLPGGATGYVSSAYIR